MICGINFPPPTQHIIYARFGDVVVPTVQLNLLLRQKTDSILGLAKSIQPRVPVTSFSDSGDSKIYPVSIPGARQTQIRPGPLLVQIQFGP